MSEEKGFVTDAARRPFGPLSPEPGVRTHEPDPSIDRWLRRAGDPPAIGERPTTESNVCSILIADPTAVKSRLKTGVL
jgi:hypothetical protein